MYHFHRIMVCCFSMPCTFPGSMLCAIKKSCWGEGLSQIQWMPLYFRSFSCIWHYCPLTLKSLFALCSLTWSTDHSINSYGPLCGRYHPKSWEYFCKQGQGSGSHWVNIPVQGKKQEFKKEIYEWHNFRLWCVLLFRIIRKDFSEEVTYELRLQWLEWIRLAYIWEESE